LSPIFYLFSNSALPPPGDQIRHSFQFFGVYRRIFRSKQTSFPTVGSNQALAGGKTFSTAHRLALRELVAHQAPVYEPQTGCGDPMSHKLTELRQA
jgi:hypothetical protein